MIRSASYQQDKRSVPLRFRHEPRLGGISAAAVDSLAAAIQTHEGYFPGSLSYRQNNPGNLRYAGQAGALPGSAGFAVFPSYDAGLSALKNQIRLDASRGSDAAGRPVVTVSDLISSWAPSNENDTGAYIASVSLQTGFDPSAALDSLGGGAVAYVPSPAVGDSSAGGSSDDISSDSLDLSAVGIASPVSLPLAVAGGLVGVLFLSRLF